jgi:two-component system cell cycle sensor histidine kinase/response regulator CckA
MVPIISAGQVLGVLAVQPLSDEVRLDARRTTLLSSLANEIGAAVVAKRLEERIAEGDKMRSSGLLAAGIAHNFNNLLQAILGQASLIEMQKDSPEAVEKASQLIVDAALKGSTLVKQLMSFAHLEEPHREVFDMNSFVEMNLENFKRLLKDNQKLRVKLDASVPKVLADPHQLIRVISAILINANEAMKEGGNIDLFTNYCVVSELRPQFEVPFGEYVRIGIRDHGIGMDSETRKRCFEPFFTTKERDDSSGLGFTGAGLGLASAFALVRKNGGRIVVDSRPGHGALFTIYVKVAKEISKDVGQSRSLSSEVEIEDSQASLLMDETTPRNKQDLPDNKK